jgi:diguanylate cyclase (GGDEF)-like protein/PAS domain S-box-containing protein
MATILVVDDRPANRDFLVTLLGYQNHRLLEASDGAEALALARSERPDLVIADILMPTMDGYEFVRQLRADPVVGATAVMFFTAHYHKHEAAALAKSCGVCQILTKPCDPEQILRAVDDSLLEQVRSRPHPRNFDQEHLRLITNKLAETADDLQVSNSRLAALVEVNLQLASERDPGQLLENVCPAARNLIGAQYAVLAVGPKRNESDGHFVTSGMETEVAEKLRNDAFHERWNDEAFAARKSRRLTNPGGDPQAVGLSPHHPTVHCLLIAPVVSLAHVYGWIALTNKIGAAEFSAEDERILSILAAQVGRIYENGSLYLQIQRHAAQLEAEIEQRNRTQEALIESEQRFRQVTENIRDVFFLVEADRNGVLYISPAYEDIWGRSCDSAYAKPESWTEAIHPDDRASALEKYKKGILTGKFQYAYRIVRPDGSIRWIESRGYPIRDDRDRIVRIAGVATDVTERKAVADQLRESDRRFKDMLANVQMVSVMLDTDARITYCNDYLLQLTGWQREDLLGRNWFEVLIPPGNNGLKAFFAKLLTDLPETSHYENEILTRSGERRLIRWNNSVLRSGVGDIVGTASIGEDITEQRRADTKIRRLNRVYAVLSGINALIVRAHDQGDLFREACRIAVQSGKFALAWIGLVAEARISVPLIAWAGSADGYRKKLEEELRDPFRSHAGMHAASEQNVLIVNDVATDPRMMFRDEALADGFRSMVMLPLCLAGNVVALFTLFSEQSGFFDEDEMKLLLDLAGDISFALDHIQKIEKLDYLACYDTLTGLANRSLFLQRLAQSNLSAASSGHKLALLLIDLERFKNVNHSLGRPSGDELLRQVAQWLTLNTGDASCLARVGADHFALVMPQVKDEGDVTRFLEKTLEAFLQHPFRLNDTVFRIAAKVGVVLFPDDGDVADTLFKNAEAALKKAKASGDRYLFYAQRMNETLIIKFTMENQLRHAVDNAEFVLHYQPKIDLASGKLTGAEALIRWNDPLTGLVPPGRFIPILEETGLIYEVGQWALHQVIKDYLRWRAEGMAAVRIAVNVSPMQLRHRSFVADIKETIGIDPNAAAGLELEITESLIMEDVKNTIDRLHAIRLMGVSIAIDDFGTGFSSLSYLARLPVDSLKIDRSFVTDMTVATGLSLVATIINLAHSLKLKVVAEGVETEEQSALLRGLNCDEMQGYLFSKPLPCDTFEERYLRPPPHLRAPVLPLHRP